MDLITIDIACEFCAAFPRFQKTCRLVKQLLHISERLCDHDMNAFFVLDTQVIDRTLFVAQL